MGIRIRSPRVSPHKKINDDYFECLTPETMKELLEACKKDEKPEMGRWGSLPLNGQVSCEGEPDHFCSHARGIKGITKDV